MLLLVGYTPRDVITREVGFLNSGFLYCDVDSTRFLASRSVLCGNGSKELNLACRHAASVANVSGALQFCFPDRCRVDFAGAL